MFLQESIDTNSYLNEGYSVEPTEAGMLSIVLESQMEGSNLMISMIRLEHTSIIKEDAALLESGIKEFFMKIVEILKKGLQFLKYVL